MFQLWYVDNRGFTSSYGSVQPTWKRALHLWTICQEGFPENRFYIRGV